MERHEPFRNQEQGESAREEKPAELRPLTVDAERAAELLCVSRAKIYAMMASGELSYVEMGRSRLKRIPYKIIEQYIETNLRNAAQVA